MDWYNYTMECRRNNGMAYICLTVTGELGLPVPLALLGAVEAFLLVGFVVFGKVVAVCACQYG